MLGQILSALAGLSSVLPVVRFTGHHLLLMNWGGYMAGKQSLELHPYDNMGATFVNDSKWVIVDWLTITGWGGDWSSMWQEVLFNDLGGYVEKEFGGRYYSKTVLGLIGVRVRYRPYEENEYERWTLELPGQACQILGIEGLKKVYNWFARNCYHFQVARIDLAFNNCPFTPKDLYDAIEKNQVKTWIKRNTDLRWIVNTRQLKDDGTIGTTGLEWGSRQSMRYIRCYDKHGYTRLEIEYKDKRADIVAGDMFIEDNTWQVAISHLRDCVDVLDNDIDQIRQTEGTRANINNHLAKWWAELVGVIGRANIRLGRTVRELTLERVTNWLYHQVAAGLSLVVDYSQVPILDDLLEVGRSRRLFSGTYAPILSAV